MKLKFKSLVACSLGLGLLIPAGQAIAQRVSMRYDDIPDVCRADLNSGRDYCNLFRLDVDGNTSRWNFDNFDNAVDVLFITDRSAYRIEDGIHYYSIRAKFVDGRQVSGVSGTCATDTPDFYSAVCQQSNGETYLYDY